MYDSTEPGSESAQRQFFRVTDNIPEETWYWLALASIGVSTSLKLASKNDWALFVGQWPPTFILSAYPTDSFVPAPSPEPWPEWGFPFARMTRWQ